MRRLIIAASVATFAAAAPAQQALQCVNPDVLNSLVFNAYADSKLVVKRAMPDIVAGFGAPADFTLIGSAVRGVNASTTVAYKTSLEADKAFDNLLRFLNAEGWQREITPEAQSPAIMMAGPPPLAAQLCRNGERRSLRVQEIEGVRYATIYGYETAPPRVCNAPRPPQTSTTSAVALNTGLGHMPQFSFPETARMDAGLPGGTINNDRTLSTSVRIRSPDTAAALAGHLSQQLVAQNWSTDARWNGALSSGSTWTRKGDDGKTYWGTLEILSIGKGIYDVGFTIASGSR